MREWAIVGLVVMAGGWLVWWGDNYGTSAHRLAQIQRELAETNERLATYNQRDDQAAIDAEVIRSEGYNKALSELQGTDRCIVTDGVAKAIARLKP